MRSTLHRVFARRALAVLVPNCALAQGAMALAFLQSCAGPGRSLASSATPVPSKIVLAELVPTGQLRAGINYGNPNNAKKDPATGQLKGVAVDVATDLATTLGVPLSVVPLHGVPAMLGSLKAGDSDVVFSYNPDQNPLTNETAPNASGKAGLACTSPIMGVDNTFLVPPESPLQSVSDYDRPGIRIAVAEGNNPDVFLSASLKNAQLIRADTPVGAWELVRAGKADGFAGSLDFINAHMPELPGSRILPGRFMVGLLAMCMTIGRPDALGYASAFIQREKSGGAVLRAIRRAGLQGVTVP